MVSFYFISFPVPNICFYSSFNNTFIEDDIKVYKKLLRVQKVVYAILQWKDLLGQ